MLSGGMDGGAWSVQVLMFPLCLSSCSYFFLSPLTVLGLRINHCPVQNEASPTKAPTQIYRCSHKYQGSLMVDVSQS